MKILKKLVFVVLIFFNLFTEQNNHFEVSFDRLFPETQIQKIYNISIDILNIINNLSLQKDITNSLGNEFFRNIFNLLVELNYQIIVLNKINNKNSILLEDKKYLMTLVIFMQNKFNQEVKILDKRILGINFLFDEANQLQNYQA